MNVLSIILTCCVSTGIGIAIFAFLKNNKVGIYCINRQKQKEVLEELEKIEEFNKKAMDLRGKPTHQCVCGSVIWNIKGSFENYEISQYFLEIQCVSCGSLATAPTPLDRENSE